MVPELLTEFLIVVKVSTDRPVRYLKYAAFLDYLGEPPDRFALFPVFIFLCEGEPGNPFGDRQQIELMSVGQRIFQLVNVAGHDRHHRCVQR